MPTQKIDPKVIFASDAPAIDKPPVFSDKTKGWDIARANDGRPEIKQMNKMQQDTDLKILWLNENAVLPYDASIDYPDGAVTIKDGSFKQLSSGEWIEFLDDFADKDAVKRGIANRYDPSLTYNSGERVVLTNGDIVKSTIDGNPNDPNSDMTGWVSVNSDSQIKTWSGRTQEQKNKDVVSNRDFSSLTDFNSAIIDGALGVLDNTNRTPPPAHGTYSRTTNLVARDSSKLKILQGTMDDPTTINAESPPLWIQRVVEHDSYSQFAHIVGGGLVEVVAKGSRTETANKGTWMGFYGNAVANSVNVGTATAPKGDTDGNVIGVTGFAAADFLFGNGRIIAGLWGYAASPVLTDTEYTNTTDTWNTVGLEINVAQRHKDAGYTSYLGGTKGGVAGIYLTNYQELNEERKSWQFGLVLHGTQLTGNNTSNDPDTWSGFHVGIQLDKIKDVGINFQTNAKRSQTIGIKFPSTQVGGLGYKTAIELGNNKINFGQYTGSDVQPYDMWNTGDQLMLRSADGVTNRRILIGDYFTETAAFTQTHTINVKWANGTTFKIPAQKV